MDIGEKKRYLDKCTFYIKTRIHLSDEEITFEARDVKIRHAQWITEEYDVLDILLGRYVYININYNRITVY